MPPYFTRALFSSSCPGLPPSMSCLSGGWPNRLLLPPVGRTTRGTGHDDRGGCMSLRRSATTSGATSSRQAMRSMSTRPTMRRSASWRSQSTRGMRAPSTATCRTAVQSVSLMSTGARRAGAGERTTAVSPRGWRRQGIGITAARCSALRASSGVCAGVDAVVEATVGGAQMCAARGPVGREAALGNIGRLAGNEIHGAMGPFERRFCGQVDQGSSAVGCGGFSGVPALWSRR